MLVCRRYLSHSVSPKCPAIVQFLDILPLVIVLLVAYVTEACHIHVEYSSYLSIFTTFWWSNAHTTPLKLEGNVNARSPIIEPTCPLIQRNASMTCPCRRKIPTYCETSMMLSHHRGDPTSCTRFHTPSGLRAHQGFFTVSLYAQVVSPTSASYPLCQQTLVRRAGTTFSTLFSILPYPVVRVYKRRAQTEVALTWMFRRAPSGSVFLVRPGAAIEWTSFDNTNHNVPRYIQKSTATRSKSSRAVSGLSVDASISVCLILDVCGHRLRNR